MEKRHYQSQLKRVVAQRNLLLIFTLLTSLCVFTLSLLLFSKKERLIVVPTEGRSYWVENSRASDAYVHKMGTFLADFLFNRSPADVEQKNRAILEHTHPACYHNIRKHLIAEQRGIIAQNQSFYFRPSRSYTNPETNSFITEGEILVFIGKEGEDPTCIQREKRKYTLQFECKEGRVMLVSLTKEKI